MKALMFMLMNRHGQDAIVQNENMQQLLDITKKKYLRYQLPEEVHILQRNGSTPQLS